MSVRIFYVSMQLAIGKISSWWEVKDNARLNTRRTTCVLAIFRRKPRAYGFSPKSRSQRLCAEVARRCPAFRLDVSIRRQTPPSTARRRTASSFFKFVDLSSGEPRWLYPIRPFYASIAFSWHTVMKIYKGFTGRERGGRGGSSR